MKSAHSSTGIELDAIDPASQGIIEAVAVEFGQVVGQALERCAHVTLFIRDQLGLPQKSIRFSTPTAAGFQA